MPGEVLAAREHVRLLQALEERDGVAHHGARIAAEGAVADDRVLRVRVDVEHRREVEVEADRGELGRRRRAAARRTRPRSPSSPSTRIGGSVRNGAGRRVTRPPS